MLKLSKKSEYGIIALKHIHECEHGGLCSAREIAVKYHIPVETIAKILQSLSRAGLVSSIKGAQGGYYLARDAQRISVSDVVRAIDGPFGIVDCAGVDDCDCAQYQLGVCNIDQPFARIQNRFQEFLEGISLLDLV